MPEQTPPSPQQIAAAQSQDNPGQQSAMELLQRRVAHLEEILARMPTPSEADLLKRVLLADVNTDGTWKEKTIVNGGIVDYGTPGTDSRQCTSADDYSKLVRIPQNTAVLLEIEDVNSHYYVQVGKNKCCLVQVGKSTGVLGRYQGAILPFMNDNLEGMFPDVYTDTNPDIYPLDSPGVGVSFGAGAGAGILAPTTHNMCEILNLAEAWFALLPDDAQVAPLSAEPLLPGSVHIGYFTGGLSDPKTPYVYVRGSDELWVEITGSTPISPGRFEYSWSARTRGVDGVWYPVTGLAGTTGSGDINLFPLNSGDVNDVDWGPAYNSEERDGNTDDGSGGIKFRVANTTHTSTQSVVAMPVPVGTIVRARLSIQQGADSNSTLKSALCVNFSLRNIQFADGQPWIQAINNSNLTAHNGTNNNIVQIVHLGSSNSTNDPNAGGRSNLTDFANISISGYNLTLRLRNIQFDSAGHYFGANGTSNSSITIPQSIYTADETWIHIDAANKTVAHIGPSTQYLAFEADTVTYATGNITAQAFSVSVDGRGHVRSATSGNTTTIPINYSGDAWINIDNGNRTILHNGPSTVTSNYTLANVSLSGSNLTIAPVKIQTDAHGHFIGMAATGSNQTVAVGLSVANSGILNCGSGGTDSHVVALELADYINGVIDGSGTVSIGVCNDSVNVVTSIGYDSSSKTLRYKTTPVTILKKGTEGSWQTILTAVACST